MGWNAVPSGFVYCITVPDCVSVTVSTTPTEVRPLPKIQKWPSIVQASRALITTSVLLGLKNQKYPVSVVRAVAVPKPLLACDALDQAAWTVNRPLSSRRVYGSVIAKWIVATELLPSVFVPSPTTVRVTDALPAAVNV